MSSNGTPKPGADCPSCETGHLIVYSGHTSGSLHVQYVRCWRCSAAPPENKIIVAADTIRKRRPRRKLPS